jgi:NADPH:quinone reductase
MRAGVITERGATPKFTEFPTPVPSDGAVLINMRTVGLGGWDVLGAYRIGEIFPCVVRAEGVGHTADGKHVYFGERAVPPYGAWAEQAIVPTPEVWEVPAGVSDRLAITMGIAATGAFVPLEQANIQRGETVLVLGATGVIGQLGLQLARHFGAGRVVGAARNEAALARLKDRGIADEVVKLGTKEDVANLKAAAGGEGFDVVLDLVYGEPFLAALKATCWGARIKTIGRGAGVTATVPIGDMLFRTIGVVGTGQRAPADRRKIWHHLLNIARKEGIDVDYVTFPFDKPGEAWQAQAKSPYAKIIATVTS